MSSDKRFPRPPVPLQRVMLNGARGIEDPFSFTTKTPLPGVAIDRTIQDGIKLQASSIMLFQSSIGPRHCSVKQNGTAPRSLLTVGDAERSMAERGHQQPSRTFHSAHPPACPITTFRQCLFRRYRLQRSLRSLSVGLHRSIITWHKTLLQRSSSLSSLPLRNKKDFSLVASLNLISLHSSLMTWLAAGPSAEMNG